MEKKLVIYVAHEVCLETLISHFAAPNNYHCLKSATRGAFLEALAKADPVLGGIESRAREIYSDPSRPLEGEDRELVKAFIEEARQYVATHYGHLAKPHWLK